MGKRTNRAVAATEYTANRVVSRQKIEAAQMDRIVAGVTAVMFNGERDPFYEPRPGTAMHRIWKGERLTFRHQRVWKKFVEDLRGAVGKSGKVSGSYGEYSDRSSGNDHTVVAFTNREYDRVTRLFNNYLDKDEYILLRDLVVDELQKPGYVQLEMVGLFKNGYKNEDQARASGITNITCLLNRIANFYSY